MWVSFNYIDGLEITKLQANKGHHSGQCDLDVAELCKDPKIQRQLKKIDPEQLKKELRQYGAWNEEELSDHNENLTRILWIACGDITDEY